MLSSLFSVKYRTVSETITLRNLKIGTPKKTTIITIVVQKTKRVVFTMQKYFFFTDGMAKSVDPDQITLEAV